jgi:hypothetical protein
MAEIEIGGQRFTVRGLRLSEVSAKKMRSLGYGRFFIAPALDGHEDQQERMGEIMDAALLIVLGRDGYEAVDKAGGLKGLQSAWRAVMAETYGLPGEEKNSSSAGSGSATPSAEPTATPAAAKSNAPDASTAPPRP